MAGHCSCRSRREASGTGRGSHLMVPKAATTITGAARFYERTADSGNTVRRGFCPRCGAAVYGWPEMLVPRPATWTTRSGFGPR